MLSAENKNQLKYALQVGSKKSENGLHWGQCLKDKPLKDLYVKSIGTIPIPISCQNVSKLVAGGGRNSSNAEKSEHQNKTEDSKTDDGSSSHSSSVKISLGSKSRISILDEAVLAVKKTIDLGDEVIKIRLNKLVLCTPERQCHKKVLDVKKPGVLFGKFILQIPVEEGYEGGILKVGNTDNNFFDFHLQSDRYFYAAAFSADVKHKWLPIQRGNMVALEFDLLWQPEPVFTISSVALPAFVIASKLAQEALSSWDAICQKTEEIKEEHNYSTVPDASRNHLLIIPLTSSYYENNFNFGSLRGTDRQMAHVLQSIEFIDVHLAVVSQTLEESADIGLKKWEVKEDSVPSNRCFKIAQWIYSSVSLPQFQPYVLDLKNQLVGDMSTILKSDGNSEQTCRHPVIVIQHRHQSIRRCCDFQFDSILDHIESRMSMDSKFIHRQSLDCLSQILDFCQERPLIVWGISDVQAAERTRRLLKICQDFQAEKDGLRLIKLLGTGEKDSPTTFCEGVRNEMVAQSIVEMLFDFGGWQVFAEAVFQLISPARLVKQLNGFVAIVFALLEHECLDGASDVMQRIFTSISSNLNVIEQFGQPQIDVYVDAVIALDTHLDGQDSSVMQFLVPVYAELTFYQQCRLLIDLQKDDFSRMKSSSSYIIFYEKMCLISLRRCFCSGTRDVLGIIKDVVACFLNLGEKEITKMFVDRVLWCRDSHAGFRHIVWMEEVIKARSSSTLTKDCVAESLKKKIDEMKLRQIVGNEEPNEQIWIAEWRHFFLVWFRVACPNSDDVITYDVFRSICLGISERRLLAIVSDLIENVKSGKVNASGTIQKLLYELGLSFLYGEKGEVRVLSSVETIVRIFTFFATETNNLLQFISRLPLHISENCKWSPSHKNALISSILSSPDIWDRVAGIPEKATLFKQCLNEFMKTWMLGLLDMFGISYSREVRVKKPTFEEGFDLWMDVKEYFVTFIRLEKKYQNLDNIFSHLFVVLTEKQLVQLMWDVYQADIKEKESLKNFPTALGAYRDLCGHFISRKSVFFRSWISDWGSKPVESMLFETVQCFLWLGDAHCVTSLASTISSMDGKTPGAIFLKIIQSGDVRRLTDSFPHVPNALSLLLATRISILKEELREKNDWQMPSFFLPAHPTVEEFLHSSVREMNYSNFRNKKEGKQFAEWLCKLVEPSNGCSVQVEVVGQHFSTVCEISKVNFSTSADEKKALVEEKVNLEKIISLLEKRMLAAGSQQVPSARGGASTEPAPAKKLKTEFGFWN